MTTTSVAASATTDRSTRLGAVLGWLPRLVVAGIFTVGALPKFFAYTPEGSKAPV